ncbi:uncharacterized protein FOMMEDRAFT_104262 [Fomitiporia mediterranea MF3/22]|uniref:uncharacterized protein n=1 Tax=Fomitiporia mediterranea (strain MF3/22) TaxID=694068 RepID=UPI00044090B5|nr:uncharacterized protein FOMMEDRAFT_104262 [Fomitiporia mediterranea MF3/22]EJD05915.1 hypothetical protein FOMMEDRAFT_104262 [Fomitiporia mediterranea MF3/22]
MILRLSLAFLFCLSFIFLSSAENVQGDNFCSELMCVTAFVNSSTITYQLTALNQLGWMAVGFGMQMADAKMVIMWPNFDGSVSLSQRTATGEVEPNPDPNPPRIATIFNPLTNSNRLAFTVPKDDTVQQNAIWALGVANPMSASVDVTLELHLDSGNFTLNLSNHINTEDIPALNPESSSMLPTDTPNSGSSASSPPESGEGTTSGEEPFETFERLIIAHAVLSAAGFLVILPAGALIARWGRTFSENWFYYHWMTQVVFSIPVVVTGWALGPLSVAAQGGVHANDSHKVLGILLFPMYLIQLCFGTFIHFRKPAYPKRHPPRHIAHGLLGMTIVALAFYQVRTGLTVDWTTATALPINLDIFSNLWIAWVVFIPVIYVMGFLLLPRQVKYERDLPPPYSPGVTVHEGNNGAGVRHLLGLEPVDDGTHDLFSEDVTRNAGERRRSSSPNSGGIEMREVPNERRTPLSLASSQLASPSPSSRTV